MVKYTCNICQEEFLRKTKLTTHQKTCKAVRVRLVKDVEFKDKVELQKPILKWVGGKTQIIEQVLSEFPIVINNYHEIFLGGGSVLFGILKYIKDKRIELNGKIYAYDLNEPLINMYKNIQSSPDKVYEKTHEMVKIINACTGKEVNRKPKNLKEAKTSQESYYYWIRSQYNSLSKDKKNSIEGSAMFIFLNKTCFRGMFREGPNGFNVPYGNYKNPSVVDKEHLNEVSKLIKDVEFITLGFEDSIKKIGTNDFAYMDPPYAPESNTSFVGYNKTGFSLDNHKLLFEMCNKLKKDKKMFLMSNANVDLVNNSFKNGFYIDTISCRRAINSKNPGAKTKEVLIKSY